MKIFFAFLISLFAFTGLASADTCKVNWVNGVCGVVKSDDSHQDPEYIDRKPPVTEEETE